MKGNIAPSVLQGPHVIAWTVVVYTPDGRVISTQVEAGSITLTGRDRSRTRGSVVIVDNGELWDDSGVTGASPYGGWVQVQATIGGETIIVGSGLILEVTRSRPGSTIDVAFVDFGAMLEWCSLPAPIGINAGESLSDWVENYVRIAAPTGYVYGPGVPATVPTSYVEQGSHESGLAKLCTDAGIVVWIDEERVCQITVDDILDTTPAVWTFADGASGTVVTESHSLSRDDVPAAIVVTGETPEGAQAPIIGQAYQSSGPTAWGGPFGFPRDRVNRPVLNSQQAADAAARTILEQRRQLTRTIDVTAVTHPGIEPGDRANVSLSGSRLAMVVQSVTFNLTPAAMRVALIEARNLGMMSAPRPTIHDTIRGLR